MSPREDHELESEWLENEGWTIGGLSPELSEMLLVWLNKQIAGVRPVNDEAASALSLLATMGVDRQAWIAPLIEGLNETLPYTRDKDRFDGYATENEKRRAVYLNRVADAVECDTDGKANEYEETAREWVEEIMARLDGGQQ